VRRRRSPPSRGRGSFGGDTPRTRTAATYDGGGQEGCPGDQRREVVHLVFLRARDAMTSAATNLACCGNAARHASRTGLQVTNPMDGSGPRGREVGGEQTVAEVRNLEDGTSRGTYPPGDADPLAHSRRRGEETPGGEPRSKGRGRQRSECPERGPSLWEPSGRTGAARLRGRAPQGARRSGRETASSTDRLVGGTPRGRGDDVEGAAKE
jgi:hypothetical protein